MSRVKVHRMNALQDNYCFLLEDTQTRTAVVVDPAEPEPVIKELRERGLKPVTVWVTHEHGDHTAGIAGVLHEFGEMPVYASALDRGRIPCQTHELTEGDSLSFAGETVQIFSTPGHAEGHIAYYLPESAHVFSGDVVFGVSCGKVFGGDFEGMFRSVSKIAALPDATQVWCGHEYTLGNLKFAAHVDPHNADVQRRLKDETVPTVPLQLGQEKRTNPFMRTSEEVVRQFTGKHEPSEVFKELRVRKDNFR